jgi:DNA-directed RNA polymerase specialized sigma subunit
VNIFDQIAESMPKRDISTDEARALTTSAREGNEQATLQLMSNYLPLMKRIIGAESRKRQIAVDMDEASSAAIEGFYAALREGADDPSYHIGLHLAWQVRFHVSMAITQSYRVTVPYATFTRCARALNAANGDGSRAMDLAAEFGVTRSTMSAFLGTFAANFDSEDDYPASERAQIHAEDLEDANRALAVLDPQSRLVIECLYGFGREAMSERQASQTLGIPRSSLQRIAKAALVRMQAALGA